MTPGATSESRERRELPDLLFCSLICRIMCCHSGVLHELSFLTLRKPVGVNQIIKHSSPMIYIFDWAEVSGPSEQTLEVAKVFLWEENCHPCCSLPRSSLPLTSSSAIITCPSCEKPLLLQWFPLVETIITITSWVPG